MLIYHRHNTIGGTRSNVNSKGGKKGRKSMKKTYKSVSKRKRPPCSSVGAAGGGSKKKEKSKVSREKKNLSKENVQFLTGLGLKVKKKR